jgi:hypothetical protein
MARAADTAGFETNLLGLLTEYCGAEGTVSSVNWLSLVQPTNQMAARAMGCANCHAGLGAKPNPVDQLTQADYDNIDCLICHSPTYERTLVSTNGKLAFVPAPGVDMTIALQGVRKPTTDMCQRCHAEVGGGPNYKRGTNPTLNSDVHLRAGIECVNCHSSLNHHITGAGDLKAVDRLDDQLSCASCHTETPHEGTNAVYNAHTSRVACQTCHIPVIARDANEPTVLTQDWTQPVLNPATGLYEPSRTLQSNIKPVYKWWNGKTQRAPVGPLGSIADEKARIYPWKEMTTRIPVDATNTSRPLPVKLESYSRDGNLTKAVAAAATESGIAYSGAWTAGVETMQLGLQHQVAPRSEALTCKDCHVPQGGRLDFQALGYNPSETAYLQSTAPWQGASHVGRFALTGGYTGPESCLLCHAGKDTELMDSIHYTWRTTNPKMAYPGGGSHGMVDRFDGTVGANATINYYADLGADGAVACGKCHVAQSPPLPNALTGKYTQAQKDGLNCLICHATPGNYDMNADGLYDPADGSALNRKLQTGAGGQRAWSLDESLRAAESVGPRVTAAVCLRCHEPQQGDPNYRRGTPYHESADVHAAAGMNCTACHPVAGHKIARGSTVVDLHGWERQDVEVDCANCHGTKPHPEWPDNPAFVPYNEHVAYISCQTCHIPWVSGISRQVYTSTAGVTNGPEASVPKLDSATGQWKPHTELSGRVRPVYRWFNGDSSMFGEALNDSSAWDSKVATRYTPRAKVYPFRNLVSGLVFDQAGLTGNAGFDPQFTLAGAIEKNEAYLKKMGFLREAGLNAKEKAALEKIPNLLSFEKEEYTRSGNLKEAIDIGLGRQAMLRAGLDPFTASTADLRTWGAREWSGTFLGLDIPDNSLDPLYNANDGPTQVVGSLISLNHAVDLTTAYKCKDCHSGSSVLDFKALSYTPAQADYLKTMFDKVQFIGTSQTASGLKLRWSSIPGRTYQLLSTTNVASGVWVAVTAPTRTISVWMERTIPATALTGSQELYFRVKETP